MEINNEEEIRNIVKLAYRSEPSPSELKKQLLEQLTLEASGASVSMSRPLWEQPRVLVPILAAVTSGLIGYGAWLSLNIIPTLLP